MIAPDLVKLIAVHGEVAAGAEVASLPHQRQCARKHRRPRHQGEHEQECHGANFIVLIRLPGGGRPSGGKLTRRSRGVYITAAGQSQPALYGGHGRFRRQTNQALAAALRSPAAVAATSAALASNEAYSSPPTLAQNPTAASTSDCADPRPAP